MSSPDRGTTGRRGDGGAKPEAAGGSSGASPDGGRPGALDERIYAVLLRLYPSDTRRRFGESMRLTFAAEARDARERGGAARTLFWCRSLAHLLAYGLAGRVARLRPTGAWIDGLGSDLRHASRRLRRTPGFTIAVIVTLALGIGANVAIFSLVHGVVLEPLPYPHADRLVSLRHSAEGAGLPLVGVSLGTWVHYREHARTLEEFTLYTPADVALLGDAGAERVSAVRVSQDFFDIFLDGPPPLGRALSDADQVPDAPPVAMIGHSLWRGRYGGDAGIVGRAVVVDGTPVEVVGVLPPDFDVPSERTRIWLAHRIDPDEVILGGFGRAAVARLAPGVDPEAAEADLRRLVPRLAERFNPVAFDLIVTGGGLDPIVEPLHETVVGDVDRMLWILLGTAIFVLAVACANVANLFLVRAEARRHEIAVRRALGAGRLQIARHHLVESLILGVTGGLGGVALAVVGVRWVVLWGPDAVPRLHQVGIDPPVLAFSAALSLGAGLLFGSIPLLRRGGTSTVAAISEGRRGATPGGDRHRVRDGLVVAQVALALVLAVGAGLMVRTFWHLRGVDPGFDTRSSLVFRLGLPEPLYPEPVEAMQFQQRVLERLGELPGAAAVGAITCLPLDGCDGRTPVYADDRPVEPGETPPSVDVRGATAGYFRAMGIPLIEGRTFEPADAGREPAAAVISRNLAERMWPGESAVGKRIHPDYPTPEEEPYTVVGVVGDVISYGLAEEPPEMLHVSFLGPYSYVARPHALTVVVRTEVPPLSLAPAVRAAIRELGPDVPLSDLRTMREVVDRAGAPTEFAMILLLIAGSISLVLGAVGVYGVLSYVVSQRTGEIGVRMALGARAADVARMVVLRGAAVATVGIALGLLGAIALSRLMTALLFGVEPVDPVTYGTVAAILAAVGLVASWLPARRAARVDPMEALRGE